MQPFGQPQPSNHGYGGYNAYSHAGYQAQQYPNPVHYSQSAYYPHYSQAAYNPAFFQRFQGVVPGHASRGRAPFTGSRGGGGYGRGGSHNNVEMSGDRGRGGFVFRSSRKKPFVGGSLETQRQWERQTLCCFFLQGNCKFFDNCRFIHEDDGKRPCQYEAQCRVGHASRTLINGGVNEDHAANKQGGAQESSLREQQTLGESS